MDHQQFANAIIAHTQTLYRVAYAQLPQPSDREDAVQETLKRAWEKRRQLRSDAYLQTWLIRILLNVCHDIQRQQKRVLLQPDMAPAAGEEPPDLGDALRSLEEKYRLPILLHYIEGYPVNQVAAMLRLPAGTVKTRLRAGRERLRDMLQEEVLES